MADGTSENHHERKFIPAFIDFIAAGLFGVAIHQKSVPHITKWQP
jgi:hypothetical protein